MNYEILNLFLLFILAFTFLISFLGYGIFFKNKIFKNKIVLNLGEVGLLGLFTLIIVSYFTILFFSHNFIHNFLILIVGLFLFLLNIKKVIFI